MRRRITKGDRMNHSADLSVMIHPLSAISQLCADTPTSDGSRRDTP